MKYAKVKRKDDSLCRACLRWNLGCPEESAHRKYGKAPYRFNVLECAEFKPEATWTWIQTDDERNK